ncbi:putative 2OG-Fe(II) oxygenase [Roseateles sp. BYS87W]|uniref:2OG-Fe(II) oxygenase n=1 Tax=Pelomonas baiyunensis TaxID=3299026 RepID=A0ABW7GZ42_9BURK
MQKQAWKLFPTLVHRYSEVLTPPQLDTILTHCLQAEAGRHGALLGDAQSTFDKDAHFLEALEATHANLQGLTQGLAQLMDAYARELGLDGARLSNSWFNIQRPGSVLRHHTHPDSRVSAALCIASDEASSKLHFENPNPLLGFIEAARPTEFNMEMAKFKLVPGDLVLFPSWLKHGSGFEANGSDLRVVISLNAGA